MADVSVEQSVLHSSSFFFFFFFFFPLFFMGFPVLVVFPLVATSPP